MLQRIQQMALFKFLYFDKTEIERLLILSSLFSVALSLLRVAYANELMFITLNWNLFLAVVPYGITRWLMARPDWVEKSGRFLFAFVSWLLFIPNAFYILTDLFHMDQKTVMPQWFDLALILSFAWNGLLLGVLSMRQMEKILELRIGLSSSWLFVYPMMLLNAFGIYLGRYLRYNSWDVLSDPLSLFKDIVHLVIHPLRNWHDWSMVLCFAVLMALMYETLKKLSKAIW
jgi:uncharacterized membrane protein